MATNGAYTKERDKGFRHILKQLKIAEGARVTIGVRGDKKHQDGEARLVDIAVWNEFGTKTIPARPFIGGNHDEKKQQYRRDLQKRFAAILAGSTVEQELAEFGELVVGDVKLYMTTLDTPPNAAATVLMKGVDNPLIDTGTLRNAIKKKVELGKSTVGQQLGKVGKE